MFLGTLFLVIGVIWLLKSLGYLSADLDLWPIVFIILGAFMILKRFGGSKKSGHFCCFDCKDEDK